MYEFSDDYPKISRHPNGFTKITVRETPSGSSERIHIWVDSGYHDSDIHQHRADFTSTIITGAMNEELYRYHDSVNGEYERAEVICTSTDDAYCVNLTHVPVRCDVELINSITRTAGDHYTRSSADLHRIVAVQVPLITHVSFNEITRAQIIMIRPVGGFTSCSVKR